MNNLDLKTINKNRKHIPMVLKQNTFGSLVDIAITNRHIDNKEIWKNGALREINFKAIYGLKYVNEYLQDIKIHNVKTMVLVDQDGDGFTSSSLIINYFKRALNVDVKPLLPDIKIHGIAQYIKRFPDKFHNHKTKDTWIIIPDSSSNDLDTIKELYDKGYKCLIIDHHDMSDKVQSKIFSSDVYKVISNQYKQYPICREYTGVGMSYLVARYIDKQLGLNYAKDYLDLVAVGQISDVSNLTLGNIHDMVMYGLNNIHNPFIKTCLSHDDTSVSIKSIQFGLVPLMNAVSRIGDMTDKKLLLKALSDVDNNDEYIYTTKKKTPSGHFKKIEIHTNLYEYAYFVLKKVKSLQDRTVKKAVSELDIKVYDQLVVAILPNKYNAGLTGLIANKLISSYNLPSFVFIHHKDAMMGSGRVPEEISGIREFVNQLDTTIFAQGHDNAFGIKIKYLDDFIHKFEATVSDTIDYNADTYKYKIDKLYVNKIPSVKDCVDVYNNSLLWCGVKDEPVIGIVGLKLDEEHVFIKNRLLRINADNGVTLISFVAPKDVIDKLSENKNTYVDIVGKPNLNFFLHKSTPQIVIDKIKITEKVINSNDMFNNLEF